MGRDWIDIKFDYIPLVLIFIEPQRENALSFG